MGPLEDRIVAVWVRTHMSFCFFLPRLDCPFLLFRWNDERLHYGYPIRLGMQSLSKLTETGWRIRSVRAILIFTALISAFAKPVPSVLTGPGIPCASPESTFSRLYYRFRSYQ